MCSNNGNVHDLNGQAMTTTGKLDPAPSYLFAFDFDHTVVHDNSDTYIFKLLEGGVPQHIQQFLNDSNWTEYMNKVFEYMHEKGVTVDDICGSVKGMEPTRGMLQLLTSLVLMKTSPDSRAKVDILIISDANDLFITQFLNARVLDPLSTNKNVQIQSTYPFDIITNTASVSTPPPMSNNNKTKPFSITPYSLQDHCKICPKNLCKGAALVEYMERKGPYSRVFYSGDGWNDVCPSLKLNQHDYVFPRKSYSLWKKINKSADNLGISSKIIEWESADTIHATIENILGKMP